MKGINLTMFEGTVETADGSVPFALTDQGLLLRGVTPALALTLLAALAVSDADDAPEEATPAEAPKRTRRAKAAPPEHVEIDVVVAAAAKPEAAAATTLAPEVVDAMLPDVGAAGAPLPSTAELAVENGEPAPEAADNPEPKALDMAKEFGEVSADDVPLQVRNAVQFREAVGHYIDAGVSDPDEITRQLRAAKEHNKMLARVPDDALSARVARVLAAYSA